MESNYCPVCGNRLNRKEIGDEGFVPYCSVCERAYFDNPIPCVIVCCVNEAEECIVLKQSYGWTDQWAFIAGFLQHGETIEEAARREVKEEVGLEGLVAVYIASYPFKIKDQIMLGVLVRANKRDFVLSEELNVAAWVPLTEVTHYLREGSIALKHAKNTLAYLKNSANNIEDCR